jgi:hypothetical protein
MVSDVSVDDRLAPLLLGLCQGCFMAARKEREEMEQERQKKKREESLGDNIHLSRHITVTYFFQPCLAF